VLAGLTGVFPAVAVTVGFGGSKFALSWSAQLTSPAAQPGHAPVRGALADAAGRGQLPSRAGDHQDGDRLLVERL
jgi:hypothetical protein